MFVRPPDACASAPVVDCAARRTSISSSRAATRVRASPRNFSCDRCACARRKLCGTRLYGIWERLVSKGIAPSIPQNRAGRRVSCPEQGRNRTEHGERVSCWTCWHCTDVSVLRCEHVSSQDGSGAPGMVEVEETLHRRRTRRHDRLRCGFHVTEEVSANVTRVRHARSPQPHLLGGGGSVVVRSALLGRVI
ncbi:hypothetical protein DAEQUDRAFT_593020 [Daedalea quercina L-15889]|uniref:Uncharacterized protein n=1 Tax=Daedalea quercina L-15889 TaxID=1314783 RepID=A0A165SX59_9APHY|nr:hypothetical protein DAEQUDRAFT_593020 [Daedalea quercina L-15889]